MKNSNTVYLYLQRILLLKAPLNRVMSRKRAIWIISKYFHFIKGLKIKALDDMVGLKLIQRIDRQKIKIINPERSEMVDKGVFLTIIESGDKIAKDEKGYWDSVDADNEKLRDIIKEIQTGLKQIDGKLEDIRNTIGKMILPDQEDS